MSGGSDLGPTSEYASTQKQDRDERQRDDRHDTVVVKHQRSRDDNERADEQLGRVADDEVLPEPSECSQSPAYRSHQAAGPVRIVAGCRMCPILRMAIVRRAAVAAKTPMSTRIMTSPPGQCTPAPSPTQKTPKLESITPTASFIEFSGISESCRATMKPTSATMIAAAAALAAASPRRPE